MKIINKKAISVIEYTVLFIIIIGAFLMMKNYIQRGLYGNWARSGQTFAFGRQYDPQKTIDCAYDPISSNWYDYNCYQYYTVSHGCNGDPACDEAVIASGQCSPSYCAALNNGQVGHSLL